MSDTSRKDLSNKELERNLALIQTFEGLDKYIELMSEFWKMTHPHEK